MCLNKILKKPFLQIFLQSRVPMGYHFSPTIKYYIEANEKSYLRYFLKFYNQFKFFNLPPYFPSLISPKFTDYQSHNFPFIIFDPYIHLIINTV